MAIPCRIKERIIRIDARLLDRYGPQGWWPTTTSPGGPPVYHKGAEGAAVGNRESFEIVVGAILTQNTAWRNVEKAIVNLTREIGLDPGAIAGCDGALESAVRPSGYFNQKAARLREISRNILDCGGIGALRGYDTDALRKLLLSWKGIGPETADSILCYAFARPVFVVDAYTMRLFRALDLPHASYGEIQAIVHQAIPPDTARYNDLHARIVKLYAMKEVEAFLKAEGCEG
jgi:endonuclease-3 related protein